MDGFPSGQRGQTVNLLQIASVVRIHPHPFKENRQTQETFTGLTSLQKFGNLLEESGTGWNCKQYAGMVE